MSVRASSRGPRRTRKRRGVTALLVLLLVCIAVVGGVGWYGITPKHGSGRVVRVEVPAGVGAATLTTVLWRAGVVEKPWLFRSLVWLTRVHTSVKTGMIPLRDDLSPRSVLRALAHGGGMVRVTIPEGFTRFDVARRLEAQGVCSAHSFLAESESTEALMRAGIQCTGVAPSAEGYLFPDTYDLQLGSPPSVVFDRMTRVFSRRLAALKAAHPEGVARARTFAGDEENIDRVLVILASVVEKETGAPEDRAHIASVFWNRLMVPEFVPRVLQSDPTVVYGCLAGGRADVLGSPSPCGDTDAGARMPITTAMLEDSHNPWNTYRHEALPPTPVCNPGVRALEAVLSPTYSHDLFFVARGDGRSVFAETYEVHQRNVRQWLHPR
jgi:UPF0755 protein